MKEYIPEPLLQGETFPGFQLNLLKNAVPWDLTGAEVKTEFRQGSKTGPVVKTCQIGTGYTITDLEGGVLRMDPFTMAMPVGRHFYDVKITQDSIVYRIVGGYVEVGQGVTQ